MRFGRRMRTLGARADRAVHEAAQRVDDTTGETSARVVELVVPAVQLLRWPTAVLQCLPLPFSAVTLVLGLAATGPWRVVLVVAALIMLAINALFWGRRRRILEAVADPAVLAGELQQLINLTGRVEDVGGVLTDLSGGAAPGLNVFTRLRGVWKGVTLPGRWLDAVDDLPRARYFAPPKTGTTVMLTVASLWLVPVSVVVAVVVTIATLAGTL